MPVLDGLRVLDLTSWRAGALTTMCLRDYGAEVLKVEPSGRESQTADASFHQWHRGKRITILDLRRGEDLQRAVELAVAADVVVEDWRPGVAARFGLDHSSLSAQAPALIHCSITGFGTDGPLASVKGYEAVVLAKAGLLWEAEALSPREGPSFIATCPASFAAAHAAIQGILAALHMRSRTGLGQEVRTSLAQALTPYDLYNWMTVSTGIAGSVPGNLGVLGMMVACTRDERWFQFANAQTAHLRAFLDAIGLLDEFDALPAAGAARDDFAVRVRRRIRERTLAEWMEVFLATDEVGVEAYRSPVEALSHEQLRASGHVVDFDHPTLGPMRQIGPLAVFAGVDPAGVAAAAPEPGGAAPTFADREAPPFLAPVREEPVARNGPLEGVTVLELAWYYAAPFGATLLADLGARVIKVESLAGDPHRWQFAPPEFCGIKVLQGKESIALDIGTAEGHEIVRRLAAASDVVLRNFRQSSSERLGVDFESLSAANPRLAYLYAGAYGAQGPYSARPAYAPTMSAAAGLHAVVLGLARMTTAETNPLAGAGADDARRLGLAGTPSGIGDSAAAIGAGTGLLLVLLAAERTGRAQLAETTMLGTNAHYISDHFIDFEGVQRPLRPDAQLHGLTALYRLYPAADGEWVFLAAPQDDEWAALCGVLDETRPGDSRLSDDPRFATADDRRANDAELAAALGPILRDLPGVEWEQRLTAADVACVEVSRTSFAAFTVTDPVMVANGHVAEASYPGFGAFRRHGPIVTFPANPPTVGSAPQTGQHTTAILTELGYSDAHIARLRADGIVTWPDG